MSIYNREKHSGFLELYIRNKRSHDPTFISLKRKYTKRKRHETELDENEENMDPKDILDIISYLKTQTFRSQLEIDNACKRMNEISVYRFKWIKDTEPSITEILNEFPLYKQSYELVS
jgi:hypothetical protein